MSAFGNSSIDYYTDKADKKTSIFPSADGLFCLNSADKPSELDNNFIISNRGVILAGNFSGVKVAEVNFPYLTPNVNSNNNSFILARVTQVLPAPPTISRQKIQIPNGFYTASTLVTTVNSALATAFPTTSITLSYDPNTLCFTLSTTAPNVTLIIYPISSGITAQAQSLLSLLGMKPQLNGGITSITGGPTTLQYSRYIDFTSDLLSQYQEMNDTSTAVLNRRHIFCRLYVSTDVSMPSTDASGNPIFAGSSIPFVIYRQFKNPKTLKWNGKDSIDRIDVQVWDENGDPFYFPTNYPGFQFTFQAVE